MKTIEYHHGGNWFDQLNNAIAVDVDSVRSVAVAVDAEGVYLPGKASNFYNGFAFLRLTWPPGIFLHLKARRDRRTQIGLGWKVNGRFAPTLRLWQSDESAAAGVHGPNLGQAAGWERGTA